LVLRRRVGAAAQADLSVCARPLMPEPPRIMSRAPVTPDRADYDVIQMNSSASARTRRPTHDVTAPAARARDGQVEDHPRPRRAARHVAGRDTLERRRSWWAKVGDDGQG